MAIVTSYTLGPQVKAWLDSEREDYADPKHWGVSRDEESKVIGQTDLAAAGVTVR